jgi:hypothetical protein
MIVHMEFVMLGQIFPLSLPLRCAIGLTKQLDITAVILIKDLEAGSCSLFQDTNLEFAWGRQRRITKNLSHENQ